MKMLHEQFNDRVPDDFDLLLKLPGVGKKECQSYNGRCVWEACYSNGYTLHKAVKQNWSCKRRKRAKKVEMALWKIVPPEEGSDLCHRLVCHGRDVCTARTKPHCTKCCLFDVCKRNGVKEYD